MKWLCCCCWSEVTLLLLLIRSDVVATQLLTLSIWCAGWLMAQCSLSWGGSGCSRRTCSLPQENRRTLTPDPRELTWWRGLVVVVVLLLLFVVVLLVVLVVLLLILLVVLLLVLVVVVLLLVVVLLILVVVLLKQVMSWCVLMFFCWFLFVFVCCVVILRSVPVVVLPFDSHDALRLCFLLQSFHLLITVRQQVEADAPVRMLTDEVERWASRAPTTKALILKSQDALMETNYWNNLLLLY